MSENHSVSGRSDEGAPALRPIPLATRLKVFFRLFLVQGSWNYETMLGTGVGYAAEPLTQMLPQESQDAARDRQVAYFNSHPYMAGVAVGALARAELDAVPPDMILRFRQALCTPLGSIGDQLIWAGWLPFSSLMGLLAFGLGAPPLTSTLTFLIIYNSLHLVLRGWGLQVGLTQGLKVSQALNMPVFRAAPQVISRAAALMAGLSIPLVMNRLWSISVIPASGFPSYTWLLALAVPGALVVASLQSKFHGWQVALGALVVLTLYAIIF